MTALGQLAPLTAIRGNVDKAGWAQSLPATKTVELFGIRFYMIHNVADLAIDPVSAGIHVVVSGHSHKSSVEWKDGTLFVNPGSAGPRRFSLPVSIARMLVGDGSIAAKIIEFA